MCQVVVCTSRGTQIGFGHVAPGGCETAAIATVYRLSPCDLHGEFRSIEDSAIWEMSGYAHDL